MARKRIDISGYIGEDWWNPEMSNTVRTVMEQAGEVAAGDVLEVHVNSGGGSFFEGLAIMNTLLQFGARGVTVETWVDGLAASAASLIMLGGSRRVVARAAMVMIHNVWSIAVGDAADLEKEAANLRAFNGVAADAYADRTLLTRDDALAAMDEETWMDGAAALDAGFATEVGSGGDDAGDPDAAARALASACDLSHLNLRRRPDWLAGAGDGRARRALAHAMSAATRAQSLSAGLPPAAPAPTPPQAGANEETKMTTKPDSGGAAEDTAAARRQGAKFAQDVAKAKVKAVAAGVPQAVADQLEAAAIESPAQDLAAFQAALFEAIQAQAAKTDPPASNTPSAQVLADGREKFVAGVSQAVMAMAGMEKRDANNEFNGITLSGIAQACLIRAGERPALTKSGLAKQVFANHTRTDFPLVLENIASKSLLRGYDEAPEIFDRFTRPGSLPDYKEAARIDMSVFANLERVEEGAEYTYATLGERGARVSLSKFGRMIQITEEMVINDDQNAFASIPRKMGAAARRTIGNLVFAVLTANPTFNGTALFHSSRQNLLTGGGSALGDAGVTSAFTQFTTRTDAQTAGGSVAEAVLNIEPRYLLVPRALQQTALRLMQAETVNSSAGALSATPNTWRGRFEVLSDARLDRAGGGATRWFFLADPDIYDTIEVDYLDGQAAPTLTRVELYKTDSIDFKVKQIAGVAPLDYAAMQRNEGA
jgi:ATP-dependent protease ClpP protease subunit